MPILVAALLGGLLQFAASMVGRVLIALGLGFVAYQGVGLALDSFKTLVVDSLNGMPAQVLQVLGLLQVDRAVNILSSAVLVRMTINGLMSGTIRKLVQK